MAVFKGPVSSASEIVEITNGNLTADDNFKPGASSIKSVENLREYPEKIIFQAPHVLIDFWAPRCSRSIQRQRSEKSRSPGSQRLAQAPIPLSPGRAPRGGIHVSGACVLHLPYSPSPPAAESHASYLPLSETSTVFEKQMQLGRSNLLKYHKFQKALGFHGRRVT